MLHIENTYMSSRKIVYVIITCVCSLMQLDCKSVGMIAEMSSDDDFSEVEEKPFLTVSEQISAHEFEGMDSIIFKYVKIDGKNRRIPCWAFAIVPSLEKVSLDSKIKVIEDNSFFSCKNLSSINLEYVDSVGENAFKFSKIHYANLKNASVIGEFAFSNCSFLESVHFSKNLNQLGDFAFFNDSLLTECIIPSGRIGKSAFMGCVNLSSISLPANLKSIEPMMFYGCMSLQKVILPKKLRIIGDFAFYGTSIEVIEIPSSVLEIGENAFQECKKLKRVVLSNPNIVIAESAFDKSVIIETRY